ncbi:hypothetical protein L226DRAFT_179376 [Lentinus tigrinus ALCF2SS1-7]|uniref:uncharacterized protein n=1 Tax=Lentinus tigrinus ALCF2SS1-7 TaxID=1328758 RepID=UPI001165F37C|nr:hypothetical protein L226DRAFT_179376 [Lentinus tigrinus ALCF2SS1-7]
MTIPQIPLHDSDINLDISGVAGFFGGDVAVSAMATVHVYQGRKWLGWYNSPGSYEIAKRYGQLGRSRFWDGLYPGINVDPAVLFELDGLNGPKYRAVHSGTVMYKTGHLAHLFLQECKNIEAAHEVDDTRVTIPVCVTVAELSHQPAVEEHPRLFRDSTSPLALIPIFTSFAAAVACAVFRDWFCFSMIVLGMLSSGVSCYVIGMGAFTFTHPAPADGAPHGDGVLEGDGDIVVLKGPEGAVNPITRGRFSLKYNSEPEYHNIGSSSMLLTIQFLAQLLIVPQGEIFGQIMFLSSLAVSWMYNSYLSSLDKESIQRRILVQQVLRVPRMRKYRLGTRTIMVVFVLLVLSPADDQMLRKVMDDLLPNETHVWTIWKETVLHAIRNINHDEKDGAFDFDLSVGEGLGANDRRLLKTLYQDARTAYVAYQELYLRGYDQFSEKLTRG